MRGEGEARRAQCLVQAGHDPIDGVSLEDYFLLLVQFVRRLCLTIRHDSLPPTERVQMLKGWPVSCPELSAPHSIKAHHWTY